LTAVLNSDDIDIVADLKSAVRAQGRLRMISVRLLPTIVLTVLLPLCGATRAGATVIDYRFVITAPFSDGFETFGGAENPVVMDFFIDETAPNIATVGGIYVAGGFGSLSFGGTSNLSSADLIQLGLNGAGAVFNAWANGYDTPAIENGRSLEMNEISIYDLTGQMLSSTKLPTVLDTQSSTSIFLMMFSSKPSDPEYSAGEWVKFDTGFVSPTYYTTNIFTIDAVPEPSTWAMMLLGFAGLGYAGYRRTHRPVSTAA
jgi:hypothetical protein